MGKASRRTWERRAEEVERARRRPPQSDEEAARVARLGEAFVGHPEAGRTLAPARERVAGESYVEVRERAARSAGPRIREATSAEADALVGGRPLVVRFGPRRSGL